MNWYKTSQKKTIEQIAQQVLKKELAYNDNDKESLRNECLPISVALKNELIKNGYAATVVQGTFSVDNPGEIYYDEDMKVIPKKERKEMMYTPLHYWVEVNGVIVDITATQFNDRIDDQMEPITIGAYSELNRYTPKSRGWK